MKAVFLLNLLFFSKASAIQEYCNPSYRPIADRSFEFDLSKLNHDFILYHNISTPPSVKSTITKINICDALSNSKSEPDCSKGTYSCQKIIYTQNETTFVAEVHDIVGDYKKSKIKTELKANEPEEDSTKSGYRYSLALTGGDNNQSAHITLECDTSQSRKGKPSSPSFVSYDYGILKFEWKTVFACTTKKTTDEGKDHRNEEAPHDNIENEEKGGISAITIFFILIFVSLIIYFAAGAAYNIKVYNAKGFDLIIHRDFWLEFPYLIKDLVMYLIDSIKPNRGGSGGYVNV